MNKNLYVCVSLMALLLLGVLPAAGQDPAAGAAKPKVALKGKVDVGVSFAANVEKVSTLSGSSRFVLYGATMDGLYKITPRWGLVGEFGGGSASQFMPGIDMNEITIGAGPRYTCASKSKFSLFGQTIFGVAYGFKGTYPGPNGARTSAKGLLVEAGGGINYELNKRFAVKLAQADYVLTKLPNAAGDTQHSPRFSAGIVAHF